MAQLGTKAREQTVFACVNIECRVVMFVATKSDRNVCPRCYVPGSLVRREGNKLGEAHALVEAKRSGQNP